MPSALGFRVRAWLAMASIWPKKCAGIRGIARPKKSFTCCRAMMTAMPLVNPITIDTGMKRIRLPSRSAPMANSSTPAPMVAISRLDTP